MLDREQGLLKILAAILPANDSNGDTTARAVNLLLSISNSLDGHCARE